MLRSAGRLRAPASALVTVAAFAVAAPQSAEAKPRAPKLTGIHCAPRSLPACRTGVRVSAGDRLRLLGQRLQRRQRVTFTWSSGARTARLGKTAGGWTVTVPPGTKSGTIRVAVVDRAGRRSNRRRIKVVLPDAAAVAPALGAETPVGGTRRTLPEAFTGHGMWITDLATTLGGDVAAITARAKAAGVTTLYVKSADGVDTNPQFTPALVAAVKAQGLRICAWQFIYGNHPLDEADAAARSVLEGADCFVINAEDQYGKVERPYAAAQQYVRALRAATANPRAPAGVPTEYPIGFSSHAQVSAHGQLPYSVFLGADGARANLPQVYWTDAQLPVDIASARAAAEHRVYGVPIAPIGQTYPTAFAAPDPGDARRFREIWSTYGAPGMSWFALHTTTEAFWAVLAEPKPPTAVLPDPGWARLAEGSTGDQVIWLQQHLATVEPSVVIDGHFGPSTAAALRRFQAARGLEATGSTDGSTWKALLLTRATPVDWTAR